MKFTVGDKVFIRELAQGSGIIKTCFLGARGWEYEVRYFNDGKAELTYFFEDELEKRNEDENPSR